jgi:hypothetical protein
VRCPFSHVVVFAAGGRESHEDVSVTFVILATTTTGFVVVRGRGGAPAHLRLIEIGTSPKGRS